MYMVGQDKKNGALWEFKGFGSYGCRSACFVKKVRLFTQHASHMILLTPCDLKEPEKWDVEKGRQEVRKKRLGAFV